MRLYVSKIGSNMAVISEQYYDRVQNNAGRYIFLANVGKYKFDGISKDGPMKAWTVSGNADRVKEHLADWVASIIESGHGVKTFDVIYYDLDWEAFRVLDGLHALLKMNYDPDTGRYINSQIVNVENSRKDLNTMYWCAGIAYMTPDVHGKYQDDTSETEKHDPLTRCYQMEASYLKLMEEKFQSLYGPPMIKC